MKRKIILTYAIILLIFISKIHSQELNNIPVIQDSQAFVSFIDSLMMKNMEDLRIPGAIISVVKDGKTILAKGYGYSDIGKKNPVTSDNTLFRIASVSKLFVGTAAMQLVENNKLNLDEAINKYLKEFKVENKFGKTLTMRHLLTHTGGFDDRYTGKVVRLQEERIPLGEFLKNFIPEIISPPGGVSTYSNIGNALAAHVIEAISGMEFHEYVKQQILLPLKMDKSGYLYGERTKELLTGVFTYDGYDINQIPFDFILDYPGGQMLTTAEEISHFMIANLNGGQYDSVSILTPNSLGIMHDTVFTHHPKLTEWMGITFGGGNVAGMKVLAHDGGYAGTSARMRLFPKHNFGFFINTNIANQSFLENIMWGLLSNYFSDLNVQDTTEYPIDPLPKYDRDVDKFTGTYRHTRYTHNYFVKFGLLFFGLGSEMNIGMNEDGMILMKKLDGNDRRMIMIEPNLFMSIDDNYYSAFRSDEAGNVTHLFTNGTTAFEKVPFIYTISVQQKLFITCSLIIFIYILLPPIVRNRIRKNKPETDPMNFQLLNLIKNTGSIYFFYFGLLFFTFYVLVSPVEMSVGFPYGMHPFLYFVQALPLIAGILTIYILYVSIKEFNNSLILSQIKIFSLLFVFISLTYLWILNYWNLLFWRF